MSGAPASLRLGGQGIVVAPGAYDAFTATLVAQAGFDAVYLTGAGVSYSQIGAPDFGLATLTEMAECLRRVRAGGGGIPVIADFDNGYGGVLNVARATEVFIDSGASAFHIEDQSYPKRCGQLAGVKVVTAGEMVDKIRAAVDTRGDRDTLIVARTDAYRPEGLDSVVARGHRYLQAGADAFFPEVSGMSTDDMEVVGREIDGPLVVAMVEGANAPFLSASELEALGYDCVLFPNSLLRAFGAAGRRVLALLAEDGTTRAMAADMLGFGDLMELLGYETLKELEDRWTTQERPRPIGEAS